jgi:broad specificity phosphatase PhoE
VTIEILYETHAVTPDNHAGIISGWRQSQLSEQGRADAKQRSQQWHAAGVEVVYCSDFDRAVQTAEIGFAETGVPIRPDARLRECNYGTLNGCTVAELDAARPAHVDVPFPGGGQSFQDVISATAAFLDDLRQRDERRVMIIAHSANKWALDCLLNGADIAELVSGPLVWQPGWRYQLAAAEAHHG